MAQQERTFEKYQRSRRMELQLPGVEDKGWTSHDQSALGE